MEPIARTSSDSDVGFMLAHADQTTQDFLQSNQEETKRTRSAHVSPTSSADLSIGVNAAASPAKEFAFPKSGSGRVKLTPRLTTVFSKIVFVPPENDLLFEDESVHKEGGSGELVDNEGKPEESVQKEETSDVFEDKEGNSDAWVHEEATVGGPPASDEVKAEVGSCSTSASNSLTKDGLEWKGLVASKSDSAAPNGADEDGSVQGGLFSSSRSETAVVYEGSRESLENFSGQKDDVVSKPRGSSGHGGSEWFKKLHVKAVKSAWNSLKSDAAKVWSPPPTNQKMPRSLRNRFRGGASWDDGEDGSRRGSSSASGEANIATGLVDPREEQESGQLEQNARPAVESPSSPEASGASAFAKHKSDGSYGPPKPRARSPLRWANALAEAKSEGSAQVDTRKGESNSVAFIVEDGGANSSVNRRPPGKGSTGAEGGAESSTGVEARDDRINGVEGEASAAEEGAKVRQKEREEAARKLKLITSSFVCRQFEREMFGGGGVRRARLAGEWTPVEGLEDFAVDMKKVLIGQQFAAGASGRLFKGSMGDQDVAVKVFKLPEEISLSGDRKFLVKQFWQEILAMASIPPHENILRFLGAAQCLPNLCVVTEFMEGGSLGAYLKQLMSEGVKLPLSAALAFGLDTARGMQHLHQQNMMHRDLKPDNLLLTSSFKLKVSDFGLCRLDHAHGGAVEMTNEMGTYRWMAPEAMEMKPYDRRVDVYSYAIVLWQLLTTQVPFNDMTPLQAAFSVCSKNMRPPMPSDLQEELKSLLECCWHRDPAKRPSFSEIASFLETQLASMEAPDFPQVTWDVVHEPIQIPCPPLSSVIPKCMSEIAETDVEKDFGREASASKRAKPKLPKFFRRTTSIKGEKNVKKSAFLEFHSVDVSKS